MSKHITKPAADLPTLDGDALLQAASNPANFAPVKLAVPEIGASVYVRQIDASELDTYATEVKDADDADTRATILAYALGTAAGLRLYTTEAQVNALKSFNAKASQRITTKFQALNGMIADANEKK